MNNTVKNEAKSALRFLTSKRTAAECMRLRGDTLSLESLEGEIRASELALSGLHPDDRYLLEELYISRDGGSVSRLCEHFGCSTSTVYRRSRHAVTEFAMRLFGRAE